MSDEVGTHRRRSSGSVLLLTAASALLPGTAHLVAGRRRVGVALVAFGVALATAAAVAAASTSRDEFLGLAVRPRVLTATFVIAGLLALLWMTLVVRSYAVLRPEGPHTSERVVGGFVVGVMCLAVALPPLAVARYAYVARGVITTVFPDAPVTVVAGAPKNTRDPWGGRQRLNLLLLASDSGPDRTGTRTDSMVVLSADVHTGDVMMFSVPRNLRRVQLPPGPLQQTWPGEFPEELNALYRRVTEHPGLLAGARDRGAVADKQAIGYLLGLRLDYYILINMEGFERFVNALGGVTINVGQRLPIGGLLGDGTRAPPSGWIEKGLQHLDGFHAEWFARSRSSTTDYDRMARQRCLIGAITQQVAPVTVLTRFQQLAGATKDLVSTDIPRVLLRPLIGLGDKIRAANRIRNLLFVPPLINTSDPDFALIRTKVQQALATPGGSRPRTTTPRATATPTTTPPPTGGSGRTGSKTTAPGVQLVSQACSLT